MSRSEAPPVPPQSTTIDYVLRLMKLAGAVPASATLYKVLGRIALRSYLHADGQRNQAWTPGCKKLYAYNDMVAKFLRSHPRR